MEEKRLKSTSVNIGNTVVRHNEWVQVEGKRITQIDDREEGWV